jgi:hypothetical protein
MSLGLQMDDLGNVDMENRIYNNWSRKYEFTFAFEVFYFCCEKSPTTRICTKIGPNVYTGHKDT